MTECPPPVSEPSAASVRRSLRALADGSAPRRRSPTPANADYDSEPPQEVVEDAERAVSCAEVAAAFLLDVGLDALDDAVRTAERCGHEPVARRGRRVRATLRDLDAAIAGRDPDALLGGRGRDASVGGRDPDAPGTGRPPGAAGIGTTER